MSLIIFYTTLPNDHEAQKICQNLLEQNLIVCGNIFPKITSFYKSDCDQGWEQSQETGLLLKTLEHKREDLQKAMETLHPYKIPVLLSFHCLSANESYLKWANQFLGNL